MENDNIYEHVNMRSADSEYDVECTMVGQFLSDGCGSDLCDYDAVMYP